MKGKHIKSVLKKKVGDWIDSIDDVEVQELCKKNTIVTGGCIASMLSGEPANDYDIYFRGIETVEAVARYYVKKFLERNAPKFKEQNKKVKVEVERSDDRVKIRVESAGIVGEKNEEDYGYFEQGQYNESDVERYISNSLTISEEKTMSQDKYRPLFLTDNAISLSGNVQVIIRFYGEPKEIHKNFDFVHCTCSYDYASNKLDLKPAAMESLLAKELYYCGSLYPVCSIFRLRKFIKRGWHINGGQMLKIAYQISELDLNDFNVLKDQLIGVDTAYFNQIVKILKDKKESDPEFEMSGAYLADLIDRIF